MKIDTPIKLTHVINMTILNTFFAFSLISIV